MKKWRTWTLSGLLPLNLVGVALYLGAASSGWAEPEVADVPGAAGGGAITWFFTAVPLLGFFSLLNFFRVPLQLVAHLEKKEWARGAVALCVPALWAIAVYADFSRHGV